MKRNFIICSILAVAMILVPLLSLREGVEKIPVETLSQSSGNEYISVLKTQNGKIERVEEREYLIGALAAEVDMTFHDEALKAQAIACYTYSLYVREKDGDDSLTGADISDSTDNHQGYLNEEERREKWGENFDKYEKKAGDIVDAVYGQAIYYEDKPILAAYHAVNNGSTQSAMTVWKEDVPYLTEKESPGDRLSTNYSETVEFDLNEFRDKLKIIDGVEFEGTEENWIGKTVTSENGYVKSIEICGNTVCSTDFRTALDLESCCFKVRTEKEKIKIEVIGKGHFVGMSQYGADYMARQGADYREILTHYYSGTKII